MLEVFAAVFCGFVLAVDLSCCRIRSVTVQGLVLVDLFQVQGVELDDLLLFCHLHLPCAAQRWDARVQAYALLSAVGHLKCLEH